MFLRRVLLLMFFAVLANGHMDDRSYLRRTLTEEVQPVMHTFFAELVSSFDSTLNTSAGMTENAHTDMMNTWRDSWHAAGWQTRVLTMEDAKQHPEFDKLDAAIQNFTMIEYDKFCYYRWIAMAAVGGGWMSDYDTLPLHSFADQGLHLPFQGAFTSYELHVPSLLSGSAHEWLRMTRRLVEYASTHPMENGFTLSDMHSLLEMGEKYPDMYISRFQVGGVKISLRGGVWPAKLCQQSTPKSMRAMHFSHELMTTVWMPRHPDAKLDDRPAIAREWLDNWLRNCGRHPLEE